MNESMRLNLNQAMSVLLGNNDQERKSFFNRHQTSIKSLIRLACRLLINDDIDERISSSRCLAKISEIESQLILDNLKSESVVQEIILSSVGQFIHSDNHSTFNETQVQLIKHYLVLLINITREEVNDQIVQPLILFNQKNGDGYLKSFHAVFTKVVQQSNDEDELIELTIQLLLNLSRSSLILKDLETEKDILISLLVDLFQCFERSVNPKIRVSCLLIVVNFLLTGYAQDNLLDPDLDLIPKILFPLAGPTSSELDDEDMAAIPLDLQYLPPETEREADACVRDALISCLLLCCNTKTGRDSLKASGTYYILRQLHKWEKDRTVQKRIEDVVDILIKEEEEFNKFPDLISTQIPDHLLGKFDEMDKDLLND